VEPRLPPEQLAHDLHPEVVGPRPPEDALRPRAAERRPHPVDVEDLAQLAHPMTLDNAGMPTADWKEHFAREEARYHDGEARLDPSDPDSHQRELTRLGNAANGTGHALLTDGRRAVTSTSRTCRSQTQCSSCRRSPSSAAWPPSSTLPSCPGGLDET